MLNYTKTTTPKVLKTKDKIILATIELFNRDGFNNVTVQDITAHLGMSLGNLTYHFPKKDDLVKKIYLKLIEEYSDILSNYRRDPDIESVELQTRLFYQFQQKYLFFYLDTLDIERAYPEIAIQHHEHIKTQIAQSKALFLANQKLGAIKQDIPETTADFVARMVWMTVALWATQKAISGITKDCEQDLVDAIWGILRPYFTEEGEKKYQAFKDANPE